MLVWRVAEGSRNSLEDGSRDRYENIILNIIGNSAISRVANLLARTIVAYNLYGKGHCKDTLKCTYARCK